MDIRLLVVFTAMKIINALLYIANSGRFGGGRLQHSSLSFRSILISSKAIENYSSYEQDEGWCLDLASFIYISPFPLQTNPTVLFLSQGTRIGEISFHPSGWGKGRRRRRESAPIPFFSLIGFIGGNHYRFLCTDNVMSSTQRRPMWEVSPSYMGIVEKNPLFRGVKNPILLHTHCSQVYI